LPARKRLDAVLIAGAGAASIAWLTRSLQRFVAGT
jgi:hypothetical protein